MPGSGRPRTEWVAFDTGFSLLKHNHPCKLRTSVPDWCHFPFSEISLFTFSSYSPSTPSTIRFLDVHSASFLTLLSSSLSARAHSIEICTMMCLDCCYLSCYHPSLSYFSSHVLCCSQWHHKHPITQLATREGSLCFCILLYLISFQVRSIFSPTHFLTLSIYLHPNSILLSPCSHNLLQELLHLVFNFVLTLCTIPFD